MAEVRVHIKPSFLGSWCYQFYIDEQIMCEMYVKEDEGMMCQVIRFEKNTYQLVIEAGK